MVCNYHLASSSGESAEKTKDCVICLELSSLKVNSFPSISKAGSLCSEFSHEPKPEGVVETPDDSLPGLYALNIYNIHENISPLKNCATKLKNEKSKLIFTVILKVILLCLYFTYFVISLLRSTQLEKTDYWCNGDGLIIIITIIFGTILIYFQILKPFCGEYVLAMIHPMLVQFANFKNRRDVRLIKHLAIIVTLVIFVVVDTRDDTSRLVSAFGAFIFVFCAIVFSLSPFKIKTDLVLWGLSLQLCLGLIFLRWKVGESFFECVSDKSSIFLSYTDVGSSFAFGDFIQTTNSYVFKILPTILFFGLLISVLNYFGVVQWILIKLGWSLEVAMEITPCETIATLGNIFFGQNQTQLIIRPYINQLTRSELHAILTSGHATVASSFFAIYLTLGIEPRHLLCASVMSAPAAIIMAKVFYPETQNSVMKSEHIKNIKSEEKSILSAVIRDLMSNLTVVGVVVGVLVTFIAFTSFLNGVVDWSCQLIGYDQGECNLQGFLGYFLMPVAWLMGIPNQDCSFVGYILGTKIFISDIVAYKELVDAFQHGLLAKRSFVITTYAICGFSSLYGMGCQVGVMASMGSSRMKDFSSVALRSLIAGNFACYLTACFAGILVEDVSLIPHGTNGTIT